MIDPTTIAAIGGVIICAGLVTWGVRGIRKGMEAQPRLDIERAINEKLEAQAERHQDPLPTDSEWERVSSERMSDPDSSS